MCVCVLIIVLLNLLLFVESASCCEFVVCVDILLLSVFVLEGAFALRVSLLNWFCSLRLFSAVNLFLC